MHVNNFNTNNSKCFNLNLTCILSQFFLYTNLKMSKRKYNQISLKEKERIINIISQPENINQKKGNPNYFRLCKPVGEGGVGHSRQKLQKW
jgi:hypothetical protein